MELFLEEINLLECAWSPTLEMTETTVLADETSKACTRRLAAIRKKDLKCKSQIVQRIATLNMSRIRERHTRYGKNSRIYSKDKVWLVNYYYERNYFL